MAENKKITQLDPVSPLTGSESFEVVQVGENRRVSWTQIKSLLLTYFDTIYKRANKTTVTSSDEITPTGGYSENEVYITALAENTTLLNPSGTYVDGYNIVINIYGVATAYTISWDTGYNGYLETLPTTTVSNKGMILGFIYFDSKWNLVSKVDEL